MSKVLFISGSNRKGNTQYILEKLYDSIECDKELVLLKDKEISYCK